MILAYTLAPFDDGWTYQLKCWIPLSCSYGKNDSNSSADGHAAMIGYAFDGYGMYQHLDPSTGKHIQT
jgi:hypothetical protein